MVKGFADTFASVDIASLDVSDVRAWALVNPGKVRYVRAMLNDALDDKLIESNPFANLRLAAPPEQRITVPTEAEVTRLAKKATPVIGSAVLLSAFTGLRQGELRALALEDVEEDGRRLDIDWQLTRDDRLKPPKKDSCGRIMVPERVRGYVMMAAAGTSADSPVRPFRLFPVSRDQVCRGFRRAQRESGVIFRWHDLRHFCATWLLDNGATVDDVAKQLRCDVDLVRRRYGHPDPEKALGRMERLVDGA